MSKDYFENKKVLVMGLGLHGGGVAVVQWLIKHGAKVTVTDLKIKEELKLSIDKIDSRKINYVLGKHRAEDFKNADIVVQNPGVPRESKYLKITKQAGAVIENEASLFFKHCPGTIIGVTGTRGKSTTAMLIYELLKKGSPSTHSAHSGTKIFLAGLPQQPMLEILDKVKSNEVVVLELSSWQLEILGQQKLSPHISIVTNIYLDHLNRYSGMSAYITAKKNIFRYQTKEDFSILNFDNKETKKMGQQVAGHRFWFSRKYFPDQNGCFVKNNKIFFRQNGKETKLVSLQDIKLPGRHNLENILAALTVAGILGVSVKKIKSVLQKFSGIESRQELLRVVNGVRYINDTTATTPDATIAALRTWNLELGTHNKKIILIAGGSDKGLDFKRLIKEIQKYCKALILLPGKGTSRIKKELQVYPAKSEQSEDLCGATSYKFTPQNPSKARICAGLQATEVDNMTDAVGIAHSLAKKGDIVLLSPACASFGLFINEFDRGDQFTKIVNSL